MLIIFAFAFQSQNASVEMIVPILGLLCTLIILYSSCELAGRMSIEFVKINDKIDQLDWYLLPIEMQQLLPIIMANAQQTVGFVCFGSLLCNRETFKKVSQAHYDRIGIEF